MTGQKSAIADDDSDSDVDGNLKKLSGKSYPGKFFLASPACSFSGLGWSLFPTYSQDFSLEEKLYMVVILYLEKLL